MKDKKPFTLSLWFDKLTMIGPDPFALSLSKRKLSTNGLGKQYWVGGFMEKYVFSIMDSLVNQYVVMGSNLYS